MALITRLTRSLLSALLLLLPSLFFLSLLPCARHQSMREQRQKTVSHGRSLPALRYPGPIMLNSLRILGLNH
jgi:hypothetical protein